MSNIAEKVAALPLSFPPPLWGRDRERGHIPQQFTPLPTPPPQGGREHASASGLVTQ
jgi:hypothetical protein